MRRERKDVVAQRDVDPEWARVVEVEGAWKLMTVGPDDPIWEAGSVEPYRGAIVRFVPGEHSDEQVDMLRLRIGQVAMATRVLPRRKAAVVVEERTQGLERCAHKRAREVVLQMVEESNTQDRSALRAFCEQVMGRAGL